MYIHIYTHTHTHKNIYFVADFQKHIFDSIKYQQYLSIFPQGGQKLLPPKLGRRPEQNTWTAALAQKEASYLSLQWVEMKGNHCLPPKIKSCPLSRMPRTKQENRLLCPSPTGFLPPFPTPSPRSDLKL